MTTAEPTNQCAEQTFAACGFKLRPGPGNQALLVAKRDGRRIFVPDTAAIALSIVRPKTFLSAPSRLDCKRFVCVTFLVAACGASSSLADSAQAKPAGAVLDRCCAAALFLAKQPVVASASMHDP